jgi:large repetitive protein
MRTLRLCLVVWTMFALAAPLAAAPHLVKDLNPGPSTAAVTLLGGGPAALGDVLYFAASDPAHGVELWRSDGTAAGTYRLTDVCAGRCSASPAAITVFGGRLYFSADDGFAGRELWTSDGTAGSERRVRDVCAGPCGAGPRTLAPAGDRLLFVAAPGARRQFWSTDGTRGGTVRVKTLCTAAEGHDCTFDTTLRSIGARALFTLNGVLWVSDGTAAGTLPLSEVVGGVLLPLTSPFVTVAGGGFAFFWTSEALWRTDGTAGGTVRLAALDDLVTNRNQVPVAVRQAMWNGALYAVLGGGELVRSDGTPAGTTRIATFRSGYDVLDLTPLPSALLFAVDEGSAPRSLWRTQGTAATTARVATVGEGEGAGFIDGMAALGDRAVLVVSRPLGDAAGLWVTDGTAAGTAPLAAAGESRGLGGLAAAGPRLFFVKSDGPAAVRLWSTDGTEAGTREVRDFGAGPGSSGPLAQAALGSFLLFSAETSGVDAPLFVSDGTAAGTRVVSDAASWASGFTRVGGRVFFPAFGLDVPDGSFTAKGLWSSDGTRAGTVQVSPVLGFQSPSPFGGGLLFAAVREASPFGADIELWRSDGTRRGTALVEDIDPRRVDTGFHHICVGASSSPGPGVVVAGRLLFAADDGVHGREPWVSDGTARGTRLLADVDPLRSPAPPPDCEDAPNDGPPDTGLPSDPAGFVRFRGGALFAADDGVHGRELWVSDGTAAGTRLVADLLPGPLGASPHDLTPFGNAVYFFARTAGAGEALWQSDGTAAGTVLVRDLALGGLPSWGRGLLAAGDRLFFALYNETTGAELGSSRGDSGSTALVADLRPGPAGSAPQSLTAVRGVLVFAADDGASGLEPWRSDGTAAGTFRLGDLNPGRAASSPGPFTLVGGVVLTGADDGVHGREPWAIPLADVLGR